MGSRKVIQDSDDDEDGGENPGSPAKVMDTRYDATSNLGHSSSASALQQSVDQSTGSTGKQYIPSKFNSFIIADPKARIAYSRDSPCPEKPDRT